MQSLIEKAADAELLREKIDFAAQRLMELEAGEFTGAAYGEKSAGRLVQRIGDRDRLWETRAGTVELRIPKLRQGSPLSRLPSATPSVSFADIPPGIGQSPMAEKALTAVILEAYVHG